MSEFLNETDGDLPQTLPQMIRHAARRFPHRQAIVDGALSIDYSDLVRRTEQAASALIALGVEAGDRVAIWAPNLHEWIIAACGIHAAGAVLVPINTRMKGAEAADVIESSRTGILFCIGEFLGQYYPDLLDGLRPAGLSNVVVLREGLSGCDGKMCWDW